MNYVPVVNAGTNSTNFLGTKVDARQDVKKDVSSLRYIVLPNWVHEEHLESTLSQPQDAYNTNAPESSGNLNPTATSTNPPADQLETLTVETPIPTVSSPVLTVCFTDSQEPSSKTRLISKRVTNQAETPSLDNILTLSNQFEDSLGVSTNSEESNRVEADVSNMETTITASPSPTLRIHRDHPKSQIISPVDTPIQTRNKSKKDPEYPARVYKVEKAMYGLHQAPRAWYGTLSKYLLTNGFQKGTIDQTLFIRRERGDFILVQVYVDDIIFGSSNPQLCREFEALIHKKLQMSAMGELNFFLGLVIPNWDFGILKTLLLTRWHTQIMTMVTIVATSTTEAEYVAAASCCGQVPLIQNQLLDYGEILVLSCKYWDG
nr:putative ribonuclease H-like domain-containing protein [Tanacetum cinerariifolium]